MESLDHGKSAVDTVAMGAAAAPISGTNLRIEADDRLPPSRGIVTTHDRAGRPLSDVDIRRWLRYTRHVLKADKIDVLALGDAVNAAPAYLDAAAELDTAISLRTDNIDGLPLDALARAGAHDICLDVTGDRWRDAAAASAAARSAGIPVRLVLRAPFDTETPPREIADRLAEAGAVLVQLCLSDAFHSPSPARLPARPALPAMEELAGALEQRGVEATLLGIPFCLLRPSSLLRAENSAQAAMDHNRYIASSLELAETLFDRRPNVSGKIVRILLSNHTLRKQPMDAILLPILLKRHYFYLVSRIWRRMTNHLSFLTSVPEQRDRAAFDRQASKARARARAQAGPECGRCALRRICDHVTPEAETVLANPPIKKVEGELVTSTLHFCAAQPKYYDAIDTARLESRTPMQDIADEAVHLITTTSPTRRIGPADYHVENAHFDRMESGLKWWSLVNDEKLSSSLGQYSLPLTISVDFGAGIADYVGFSFGRHCKILCPMEGYRHNVTLHIAADGRYVLLRDKHPVRPVEFEGLHYLPLRLGDSLEPRISMWNIDECLATQNVSIWEAQDAAGASAQRLKYSIIIVSTRFTRRLQAVLRNLAHQQDFDLTSAEIIVCYVPGIDATDDLLDSVSLSYPLLNIVRSPFPEKYVRSKGFLINETAKIAQGEWIMLLDSDTLLPPDYFAKIEAVSDDAEFIAPDGRRLLTKETTAKILMGEVNAWEHWEDLLMGEGEFRHRETMGIPVGFCQCFRAKYLQQFPYLEEDHFETADMHFGYLLQKHIGSETRLSGTPVLHLDHGGSQWYGTQKHM